MAPRDALVAQGAVGRDALVAHGSARRDALVAYARASMARGSKSFGAASRLFDPVMRERVWMLYAWCRACDDLVDGQDHGGTLGPLQRSQRPAPDTRRPVALHGAKNPGFSSGLDMVRHGPYKQF